LSSQRKRIELTEHKCVFGMPFPVFNSQPHFKVYLRNF